MSVLQIKILTVYICLSINNPSYSNENHFQEIDKKLIIR